MAEIYENIMKPIIAENKKPSEIEITDFGKKNIESEKFQKTKEKVDMIFDDQEDFSVEKIKTRNQELNNKEHPETGVPFEEVIVENDKGELVEVVVPKFESVLDVKLPENLEKSTDKNQFDECNSKLKEAVEKNPELKAKFDDEQLDQISNGETPEGYTWHHDAEKGKMQLVDSKIHAKTGHTGGKSIWGGGSNSRYLRG